MMAAKKGRRRAGLTYTFIDVDLRTRRIVKVGAQKRETVAITLEPPLHRVFVTTGQWNKLVRALDGAPKNP